MVDVSTALKNGMMMTLARRCRAVLSRHGCDQRARRNGEWKTVGVAAVLFAVCPLCMVAVEHSGVTVTALVTPSQRRYLSTSRQSSLFSGLATCDFARKGTSVLRRRRMLSSRLWWGFPRDDEEEEEEEVWSFADDDAEEGIDDEDEDEIDEHDYFADFEEGGRNVMSIESAVGDCSAGYYMPSERDLARIRSVRTRLRTFPVVMLDEVVLPGQTFQLQSEDVTLRKLVTASLCEYEGMVGLIGLNPDTGRLYPFGVTVSLKNAEPNRLLSRGSVDVLVRGDARFRLQDKWRVYFKSTEMATTVRSGGDGTRNSKRSLFYNVGDVEVMDRGREVLSEIEERKARDLLPKLQLLNDWASLLVETGKCDEQELYRRMDELGEAPKEAGLVAMWVAATIDPIQPFPGGRVCLDIRPAMLAAKNDYERLSLVIDALESSVDHLSGRKRLF